MSTTRPPAARRTPPGPPYLGALLRLSWQGVRARLDAAIRAAGFTDLQETHLAVFSYPPPDGVRPSELARRLGMTRQAANYVILQMEALGYLERRAAAGSERRLVWLTRRGWRVLETIFACSQAIEADWAQQLGRPRFRDLKSVLRQMAGEDGAAPAQTRAARDGQSRS